MCLPHLKYKWLILKYFPTLLIYMKGECKGFVPRSSG
ncbi:UNVERIFIED_CONTAM: hypothetical protein GTU68_017264 [Idotea baltica]|nr:hypothetical protein [Idotea baltica]